MTFERAVVFYAVVNTAVIAVLAWRLSRLWYWSCKIGTWLGSFNRRLADLERVKIGTWLGSFNRRLADLERVPSKWKPR